MAPEIVYKKPYDYRVDIWSLGVLLYELIHGESPYKGRSHVEICKSLSRGLIKFSYNCHADAKDLIQSILKQNPNDRLSISQILSHPWVNYHLSKQENNAVLSIPKERILLHSHSLPADGPLGTDGMITRRNYEPFTATPSQDKILAYGNQSDIVSKKYLDFESGRSEIHTPTSAKTPNNLNFSNKTANVSPFEEKIREPIQPSSSYQKRTEYLKPFDQNISLFEIKQERSASPFSPIGTKENVLNNEKAPKSPQSKNKVFETNIFSPSFKNKLTNVIKQLTVQPPSNTQTKRTDRVLVNQTAIHSAHNASFSYVPQLDLSYSHSTAQYYKEESLLKNLLNEEDKSPGGGNSFSSSTMQPKSEFHPDDLNRLKSVYKDPILLPKGDEYPILTSALTTRTNTSDISYGEIRSPFEKSNYKETNTKIKFVSKSEKESSVYEKTKSKISNGVAYVNTMKDKAQGAFNKKAIELKGLLGPNIIKYRIPITVNTNREIRHNKENLR